jgi:NAD(P)H dehydrogenase (quinone)
MSPHPLIRRQLRKAFAGADKLLFVSGSEIGKRIEQHGNVVAAAKDAGVSKVVYTSAPYADTSNMILAGEHLATERALLDTGIPSVFLRNSWYYENYDLKGALEHGLSGASGDGKFSFATRADLAEAAAAAIAADDLDKQVYELGGEAATMSDLAAEVSRQSGREVTFTNLTPEKYQEFLVSVGLAEPHAAVLADADRGASEGLLDTGTEDLAALLGRPATSLTEAVSQRLA